MVLDTWLRVTNNKLKKQGMKHSWYIQFIHLFILSLLSSTTQQASTVTTNNVSNIVLSPRDQRQTRSSSGLQGAVWMVRGEAQQPMENHGHRVQRRQNSVGRTKRVLMGKVTLPSASVVWKQPQDVSRGQGEVEIWKVRDWWVLE